VNSWHIQQLQAQTGAVRLLTSDIMKVSWPDDGKRAGQIFDTLPPPVLAGRCGTNGFVRQILPKTKLIKVTRRNPDWG